MNGVSKSLVIGLVYPAVLGTLLYQLLETLISGSAIISVTTLIPSVLICTAVVLHYVVDYAYTAAFASQVSYNKRAALWDFMIIVSLFMGLRPITGGNSI